MIGSHFSVRSKPLISTKSCTICCACLALLVACIKPEGETITGEITRELPNCGAGIGVDVEIVAQSLELPWNAVVIDSGDILFTERTGGLRIIRYGTKIAETLRKFNVANEGVVGLTALAMREVEQGVIEVFIARTVSTESGNKFASSLRKLRNKVMSRVNRLAGHEFEVQVSRLTLKLPGTLSEGEIILRLPASRLHGTGALEIGRDGSLYAAVGDTNRPLISQSEDSLAGKIIRLRRDEATGQFKPEVVASGLRNPQSMAWGESEDFFWATDHGEQGHDELNLIRPGRNYGWPYIEGQAANENEFSNPWVVWVNAVAPSSVEYFRQPGHPWDGDLFVTSLLGQALIRIETMYDQKDIPTAVCQERLLDGEYGRLRFVSQGPDGALYVGTSNKDYRGVPTPDDDRIIKVSLAGHGL